MAENYSSGTIPQRTNPIRVIEVKILNALNNGAGGATGSGAGYSGAGSPEGSVTANPGSTYYNTSDSTFWVKGSGTSNTGWVQVA